MPVCPDKTGTLHTDMTDVNCCNPSQFAKSIREDVAHSEGLSEDHNEDTACMIGLTCVSHV